MAEIEGPYDVVINEDKELMFCIKPRPHIPTSPRLYYVAGGMTAVLIRDAVTEIVLEWLPPQTRDCLDEVDKILVAEINQTNKRIEHEYFADVSIVQELPL